MLPVDVSALPHIYQDNLPTLDHTPLITEQLPVNTVQENSGEQQREERDEEDSIPDRLEQKPLLSHNSLS